MFPASGSPKRIPQPRYPNTALVDSLNNKSRILEASLETFDCNIASLCRYGKDNLAQAARCHKPSARPQQPETESFDCRSCNPLNAVYLNQWRWLDKAPPFLGRNVSNVSTPSPVNAKVIKATIKQVTRTAQLMFTVSGLDILAMVAIIQTIVSHNAS